MVSMWSIMPATILVLFTSVSEMSDLSGDDKAFVAEYARRRPVEVKQDTGV